MKKGKNNKKIQSVIVRRVCVCVLIVFVVIFAISLSNVSKEMTMANETEVTLQSQSAANRLEGFFNQYRKISEEMAVNPQIRNVLRESVAGDNITHASQFPTVLENLINIQQTDPENIMAAWMADLDANMVTQSDGFTSGEGWEITQRAWYYCMETGETILTEPYVDASTGKTILSTVAPVYDVDGTVLGVAGLDISLEHMIKIMEGYIIGENGYVMLFSKQDLAVYHPNEQFIQKAIKDIPMSENVMLAVEEDTVGYLTYENDEVEYYGYAQNIDDTGYLVVSALPTSEFHADLNSIVGKLCGAFILGMILILVTVISIAKGITKPILKLNETALRLAEGDLDVDIDVASRDEIGQLADSIAATVARLKEYINYIDEISDVLDDMAEGKLNIQLKNDYLGEFQKVKVALVNISTSMSQIMENINTTAGQVSIGADELARASQRLAAGATGQAESVEDLVDTANVIAGNVESTREEAEKSAIETAELTNMMVDSKVQMEQMLEAMNRIKETSNQVVGVIKTIDDIAFQTNILALNASVEAARAGEAGKGFAVVADEVRVLAQKSAEAASSSRNLISVSIGEIERGNEIVYAVSNTIENVVSAVDNVNVLIKTSVDNAVEQADGIEKIRQGIEYIAGGIQDNSATAEETASTSEELAAQASMLNEMVNKFEI